ncbi:unnamed protein product [Paramecium octaurelia]|uniref:Uncharacterized protein n=1 Tax=Paramecium octaurelia TaxID=43137 RepID=A0A8S1YC41_PAROT|nr:unnamed protein product [Paramecium octaurelia]
MIVEIINIIFDKMDSSGQQKNYFGLQYIKICQMDHCI